MKRGDYLERENRLRRQGATEQENWVRRFAGVLPRKKNEKDYQGAQRCCRD